VEAAVRLLCRRAAVRDVGADRQRPQEIAARCADALGDSERRRQHRDVHVHGCRPPIES
jgi:hypothetical protein